MLLRKYNLGKGGWGESTPFKKNFLNVIHSLYRNHPQMPAHQLDGCRAGVSERSRRAPGHKGRIPAPEVRGVGFHEKRPHLVRRLLPCRDQASPNRGLNGIRCCRRVVLYPQAFIQQKTHRAGKNEKRRARGLQDH